MPPPLAPVKPIKKIDSAELAKGREQLTPLLEYIRREQQPAVAALMGNAFFMKRDGDNITFYFDRSHANLIPMIRSANNQRVLQDAADKFFRGKFTLNFSIGNDPGVKAAKEREANMLATVKDNPIVKQLMEQYRGTIINCKILDK